ncbi:ATP-binding protein [Actinosynnema pretiosum subsp. pretiosum]|uniref:ATP-binding protein n=1 Tax=Actinosynnema pretiosum subsp. pretiosum TaxID=103721 RepID=A0AA45R5A5_9PSEU|nr:ATP-binding protein [Actinosynnema pretiosum subsp. pretiosum]
MTDRRPPPLRGREAELARRVDLLARGAGGALVLEGASGSGKTRLLDEVAARALDAGLRVFTGAGQRGWQVPELLDGLPGAGGGRWRRAGAGAARQPGAGRARRARAGGAGRLPVADPAAAKAARVLVRRPAADPVLWVIARRPAPDDHPDVPVLRLGDLDAAAVRDLARDALGGAPDAPLTGLLAGALGTPLLIGELLHGLLDEAAVHVRDGVAALREGTAPPLRFRESVRGRVRQLSGPAREAVPSWGARSPPGSSPGCWTARPPPCSDRCGRPWTPSWWSSAASGSRSGTTSCARPSRAGCPNRCAATCAGRPWRRAWPRARPPPTSPRSCCAPPPGATSAPSRCCGARRPRSRPARRWSPPR